MDHAKPEHLPVKYWQIVTAIERDDSVCVLAIDQAVIAHGQQLITSNGSFFLLRALFERRHSMSYGKIVEPNSRHEMSARALTR